MKSTTHRHRLALKAVIGTLFLAQSLQKLLSLEQAEINFEKISSRAKLNHFRKVQDWRWVQSCRRRYQSAILPISRHARPPREPRTRHKI